MTSSKQEFYMKDKNSKKILNFIENYLLEKKNIKYF